MKTKEELLAMNHEELAKYAEEKQNEVVLSDYLTCLLYTSPSPRDTR